MDNKKSNISTYLVIFGAILAFIFVIYATDNRRYDILNQYQLILLEDSCNIKLRTVSFDKGWVKAVGVDMDSLLFVNSHNYSNEERYGESSFGHFIRPGDVVLKSAGNDTFFVYRDDKKFFFVVDYDAPLDSNVTH